MNHGFASSDRHQLKVACERLYQRHQSSLVQFAGRHGCDEHEAWDVVQDLFLRAFRRGMIVELSSWAVEGQRAWLLRTLRWMLCNQHRDRTRQKRGSAAVVESLEQMLDDGHDVPHHVTPATEHDRRWALGVVERGLSRLRASTGAKLWADVEPYLWTRTSQASSATRVAVHRARVRLREFIRSESTETALFEAAGGCN
jgi:DNA-directed RNA polymerase specialized sigma24 family protein